MEFTKVTKLPEGLSYKAIEEAVRQFVKDSHTKETGADEEGLYNQTLETIANSVIFGNESRHVWIAHYGDEVMAYAITGVSKDVDNKLCYWITQAWANPKIRGHKIIKIWFEGFREDAKRLGCKHVIVPSSRGTKAYLRFLGKNWNTYLTLLKEDI